MKKAKILIVEDEAVTAMSIQNILERQGYSVIAIANTGDMAIKEALENRPDVILMDIRLKGEMDGIEAASQIRSQADIPIIFLTAYAEDEKLERAKLVLPYGYLLKPVQDRDLKATIEMALYAAQINTERNQAVDALREMQHELENKVEERTIDLQKAKETAEKANQAKTDYLNKVTHEIRTPLHHIISFATFGFNKIGSIPENKTRDYFKTIKQSGSELVVLLDELLDLAKLESGKVDYQKTETSLNKIVANSVMECQKTAEEKDITIVIKESSESTKLICDAQKIRQVIVNLLSNALKFTSLGGKIQINIDQGSLALGRRKEDDKVIPALLVAIRDEGVGIPENELDTIFNKFYQSSKTRTTFSGTGLGLAICSEIILAHNGKIWAENNAEGGSTFRFVLPYKQ